MHKKVKLEDGQYYWFKRKDSTEWRLGLIRENDVGQRFVHTMGADTWRMDSGSLMGQDQFVWRRANHPDACLTPSAENMLASAELSPGLSLSLLRDMDKVMASIHHDSDDIDPDAKAQQMAQSVVGLLRNHLSRRMTKWLTVAFLDELQDRMEGLHVPGLGEVQRAASFLNAQVTLKDDNLPLAPDALSHDTPSL